MVAAPFSIVADCGDFLVIDKAPGVSVHRDRERRGLLELIAAELDCGPLFLVHRLDRMTSGLLLLARSAAACAALAALFARRGIDKYYVALADAKPAKKQGLVKGDMERTRNGSWRLSRQQSDPASTRFFSYGVRPGLRLFVLRPRTGKTHQLRVAMKSLGAPIIGDERYGGSVADRGYLHAAALRFEYGGKHFEFCAAPRSGALFNDAEVAAALQSVLPPWALPWPAEKTAARA